MLSIKKQTIATFLSVLTFLVSCGGTNESEPYINSDLELINSYNLDVSEPSGLGINMEGTQLFTVSDNTNLIYKLSTTGNILKTYAYIGNDLEGVTAISNSLLLIAEERTKEIVEIDLNSESFVKHEINYENNALNSGIEGLTYNNRNGDIFILNEKNPGLLIKLSSNFLIESIVELKFASDYSGICYDHLLNVLWIISDQSKTLNKCKLSGELIKKYSTQISKAEGIVVSNDKVYMVSDSAEKLYIFKKPTN